MKKKIMIVCSALFLCAFVVTVYAFQANSGTLAGTEHSCCAMHDCCKDGDCKMDWDCCKGGDSCAMKQEKESADGGERHPNVIFAGGGHSESCCKAGASCCNGGRCCARKSKPETLS